MMISVRCVAKVVVVAAMVMLAAGAVQAIMIDTVPVGDPGNAGEPFAYGSRICGAVGYNYRIGKYEVTNSQYAEFLNAVAASSDTYGLWNSHMGSDGSGGITRAVSGSGSFAYSVKAGQGIQPVDNVTWYNAIRFVNWLTNGQGNGNTESGSYLISGSGPNWTVTVPSESQRAGWAGGGSGVHWLLPSENEWYKAAYYKGGGTAAGYWNYPTRSDTEPLWGPPSGGMNAANFLDATGRHALTGSASYDSSVDYLTDVGAYYNSVSAYGTFDQAGNVWEWLEKRPDTSLSYMRGGSFDDGPQCLAADWPITMGSTGVWYDMGFRVANVPEPATLSLLALGGLTLLRRTRRK
jgi:formylglycine-generating enzyme required for sulfatase activity